MKIDFHVHTKHSPDSIINPKDLAKKSAMFGIIPAITDHNTTAAHTEFKGFRIPFIPGEEVRTVEGDLIGLYVEEEIPRKTPFLEALDLIRGQGGISYLPHPFDITRHGVKDGELASKVDIIEIFNSRCPLHSYNLAAERLAKAKKKLPSAGSDSHFLFEFGSTFVQMEEFDLGNPKALLKALNGARIHASKAPIFVRGSTLLVKHAKKLLQGVLGHGHPG